MRSLNNFRAEQPHQHAMYYLRLLITEVAWTKDELRDALDGAKPFHCSVKASAVVSCMRVHAVIVSQMWRYLVWRRSYRSCCHGYTLKLCCMATSPNRFVWKAFFLDDIQKRQVCLQTIPVQINEPYCFLSTVCLKNLWIFFCKLVIHWINSRIDKAYVLSRFSL